MFTLLGILVLIGLNKVNCQACEVQYQCTNFRRTYLNLELSLNYQFSHISLNTLRHPEGTIIIDHIGSHPVKYEVISANTTFIRATVTMNPVELNGTIISCNGITMNVSISIPSKWLHINK